MFKKNTVLFILSTLMALSVKAQPDLYVMFKDGSVNDSAISSVKKITFRESIMVLQYQNGDSTLIPLNTISNILFSNLSEIEQVKDENIQIYLDPNKDILTVVQNEKQSATLYLYGIDGKLRLERALQSGRSEINTGHLKNGLYLLIVNHTRVKIIVQ
jgi:hypothetical protein